MPESKPPGRQVESRLMEAGQDLTRQALASCREFLTSFGQAVKLSALYKPGHPVANATLEEAANALRRMFGQLRCRELVLARVDGRWIMNGIVLGDIQGPAEILQGIYKKQGIESMTFQGTVFPYEFAALCGLAALDSPDESGVRPADYLEQKGVRNISINASRYAKVAGKETPVEPPVQPWRQRAAPPRPALPAARPETVPTPAPVVTRAPAPAAVPASRGTGPAAAPAARGAGPGPGGAPVVGGAGQGTGPGAGQGAGPAAAPAPSGPGGTPGAQPVSAGGFGRLVQGLVEKAVSDPGEQGRIYAEMVQTVKEALQRRVSEATRVIRLEKQQVVSQMARTEQVLGAVSVGKVVVDKDGRILTMDPAAEQIVGKRLSEVAGKHLLESVDPGEQMASLSRDMVMDPEQDPTGQVSVAGEEDVVDAMRQSMALVQDESGRVVGTYGVLPDAAKFREAVRMQDEFAANMTHELKAPLSAICSSIELIETLSSDKLGPQERKFLDISRRNSVRLRQMIDEILDFSKIQSGAMTVRPLPTDAARIAREAVESLRPWASSKKIDVSFAAAPDVEGIRVLADYNRVVQVLNNLLSNAIKSTPEGGRIEVSVAVGSAATAGRAVFSVLDTGCGISEEDQKRLFSRFVQVSQEGRRREGVGLGLYLTRQLVGLHQGETWLTSELGRGSTFYFTLPLAGPSDLDLNSSVNGSR